MIQNLGIDTHETKDGKAFKRLPNQGGKRVNYYMMHDDLEALNQIKKLVYAYSEGEKLKEATQIRQAVRDYITKAKREMSKWRADNLKYAEAKEAEAKIDKFGVSIDSIISGKQKTKKGVKRIRRK